LRCGEATVTLPPFQRFLERNSEDVWRFLRASVGAQAAEDCYQETFLAALRAYPRLQPDSNLRAWVLTIAHRKAIDHYRARHTVPLEQVAEPATYDGDRDGTIWSAVHQLPDRQRAAVLLRYLGDLRHREIAGALGCSEEAARRSLHEGLKKLREAA
jgi:RNA polymerase sigma factor (sigma-70 family)